MNGQWSPYKARTFSIQYYQMVFAIGEHIGDGTVFDMAPEAVE
jgi:hypothetical protein